MKNSKRLLATLLTLCIMASFVFTGTAFAAGEAAVTLTFPAQIVNVNGTASLSLTGATADSWESSDDAIATVENGVVTGKAIGRVTITAKSGEEAIASIEIPVVGENLLIRNGVNHGEFEGGQNSVWTDRPARLRSTHAKGKVGFWAAPIDSNVNTYQESSTVIQGESPLGTTNLLKCSNTTTDAGVNSVYIGTSYFKNTSETTDYGAVKLDTDKMYEFTGWAKFEATEGTTTTFNGNARIFYYDDVDHASSTFPDKTDPAVSKGNMKNYLTEISATTDWCFFNTTPHDLWSYKNTVSYTGDTYMQPRISMKNVNGWLGDFYVSNLSFHEVVYDPVFKSNKGLNNAKVGFYASTTFQHLSNTGKEVKSFDANGAEEAIPVTYESLTPEVATITYREDDGTKKWMIDAVGAGEAVITATANLGGKEYTRTITFTVAPDEDQALVDAFDATIEKGVSYDAPTVAGVTVEGGVIKASESGDGTFTLTADAEDKDGNKFLYWAKGKTLGKKIISFSNVLTNYMPEANDKNHILIAVYEGDVPEKEEWYNANGQRITTGTEPETYPSMAGYGTAVGWNDYNEMIHVAKYERKTPIAGIDVTVVKGNGGGTDITYGDTVTCTADEEKYGNFKCWTKTGINGETEIVSVDREYKFQAWETCTVEAVYQDNYTYNGNTMKIILDVFTAGNEKAVMAEFTGFGKKTVEKGIIWNGTKIAMTKPGTQFTLTGNVGDTFKGYAIVDNGNGTYNEVTDGSVTIAE